MELKNKRLIDLSQHELRSLVGACIKVQKVSARYPFYKLITEDLSNLIDKVEVVVEWIAEVTVNTDIHRTTIYFKLDVRFADGILLDEEDKILYIFLEKTPEQLGFKFS